MRGGVPGRSKELPNHKALDMLPKQPILESERERFEFFLDLPPIDRREVAVATLKGSQALRPLFEFSSACAGCGETPYLKLLSQLFGDRLVVANATGCSSIFGGNLPTTPWTVDAAGSGPAWSNSLFEDNAEFGLGLRLGADARHRSGSRHRRPATCDRYRTRRRSRHRRSRHGRQASSISASGSLPLVIASRPSHPLRQRRRFRCSMPSFARVYGSSGVTGGLMTSGSAGLTTCSLRAAT